MIKLPLQRKSTEPDSNTAGVPNQQNISRRGDLVRRSTGFGLLVIIGVTVAVVAYAALVRAPAQRDHFVASATTAEANSRAQAVSSAVQDLAARLSAASSTDWVTAALLSGESDALATTERELLKLFPEAAGLRLIPLSSMGTADAGAGMETLRNHIEVDLVRRVSNGEDAQIEAYQHEGRWLASIARMTESESGRRGALLLTLSETTLQGFLTTPENHPGSFALFQRIYSDNGDREIEVMGAASGVRSRAARADVANTQWQVEFRPTQRLIEKAAQASAGSLTALLIIALAGIAGTLYVCLDAKRALAADVERIRGAAQHRTPFAVRVPELLPVARDLRRTTLRGARTAANVHASGERRGATSTAALGSIDGAVSVELPAQIFRAYDIRGQAETELTNETVYRIGCSLATIAGELGEQALFLAYDGRPSSTRIRDVIEKALLRCGRDVIDIGLVPTPLLYFATHRSDQKSGIMITGSHSPADINGLKIVMQGRTLAEGDIARVRDIAQKGPFSQGTGHMIQQSVVSDYLDEIVGDIAIAIPLKIVVDAGNGATSHIAPDLFEELGCDVVPLNCEIDGSFPNRSPDTSDEDALESLVQEVLAHKADFGVAYDGDGDRLAVVTGSGRILRTDTLMMLLARDVVSRHPGADVVYDVKCTRNLGRLITNLGGRPVLWKTGHALMKQKMLETGALLGGEFSGHIFFGERWYGFDDAMYTTGRLAEILASVGEDLDAHISDLPVSTSTPEILIPIDDGKKFDLMQRFIAEAKFSGGKSNDLDGLRVDFQDGWGLLRASNTGPNLTARFEGDSEAAMKQIQGLFKEQLAKIDPDLEFPS